MTPFFRCRFLLAVALSAIAALPSNAGGNTYLEMMTVHLDAPVTRLPPPEDAGARREAFARRHSPDQAEQLAHRLFALWDREQRRSSPLPVTRRLDKRKAAVVELYEEGKYREALDAFRACFFAKVLLLWNDEKGLVSRDFEMRFARDWATRNYEDNVTLLMENTYQARTTKETVDLGEMGALRWDWQPEGLQNPWYTPLVFEYFASEHNFRTLWWKFVDTGDRRYLDKYLEYYDDYTMNCRVQENLNPLNLDYGKQGHGNCEHFIHALSEIARVLPPGGEGFPSTTLARILVRQLTVLLPQSLYYNREQSGNHSCGAVHVQQFLSYSSTTSGSPGCWRTSRAGSSKSTTPSSTCRTARCTDAWPGTAATSSPRTPSTSTGSGKPIPSGSPPAGSWSTRTASPNACSGTSTSSKPGARC